MAKVANSINEQMFYALKISEASGVPALFISNPGVGKSTTVKIFSEIRGYHLLTLRGNSTSADEISGYDTVPGDLKEGDHRAAIGLRPSWFQELMDVHEKGGKTLLFLDEITTASTFVQGPLLHIIFEKSCKDEKFPEDTLIVAAGNYAENLSATVELLSPIMNRFMIYNLVPKASDFDLFLNDFDGALVNKDHKPNDKTAALRKMLVDMDNQGISVNGNDYYCIGEFFQNAVRETTKVIIDSTKEHNPKIKDLSSIYTNTDIDAPLFGFITPRTTYYLLKWTLATYICFGPQGIKSDNFFNSLNGLVGYGLSRKSESDVVILNKVGKKYQTAIIATLQDIEKLSNEALPEYENFFVNILDGKTTLDKADMVAFIAKVKALQVDPAIKNIERPINENIMSLFNKAIIATGTKLRNLLKKVNTSSEEALDKSITPEQFGGYIETWNLISDLTNTVSEVVSDSARAYKGKERTELVASIDSLSMNVLMKVKSIKKLLMAYKSGIVISDVHELKKFTA